MSAKTSYEVHVMRGGRWVTNGIYQDKDDALRDARGPMGKRYLGIRVIEEIFDPDRERFVTRTIYRDQARVASAEASSSNPALAPAPPRARSRHAGGSEGTLGSAALGLVGMSSVLLLGIGGLFWFGLI